MPPAMTLRALFARFLRFGFLAWGGPVAQIAMMHRDLVERDAWVDETRFRKQLAVYQALPGPEATELAVWFGTLQRGRWGGLVAGLGFALPGIVLVTIVAALYVAFADTMRWGDVALHGVRPAVLALIALGFLRLARASLRGLDLLGVALLAAGVGFGFPQVNFVLVLLVGGIVVAAGRFASRGGRVLSFAPVAVLAAAAFPALSAAGLVGLAILSLKVGLLTFGGAYTAIPFLHEGAVVEHAWVTEDEFLDAIALSGIVPGPLIGVAVFVGYQAAGLIGATIAAVLVFAPAFGFTLVGHGLFERLIEDERLHDFLLGVTAAVIGLILVALVPLARAAIVDRVTLAIGLGALSLLAWGRVPTPIVLLLAGGAGALAQYAP